MKNSRKNESKMAELVSVAVKPGTIVSLQVRGEKGLTNYVGPVERMGVESLTIIYGAHKLRKGIPVSITTNGKVEVYGAEIKSYSVLGSILGCVVPRFKPLPPVY